MRGLLASPLGLLVGLCLGALGGGGSILTVPALVYGAGEPPQAATATSLVIVGLSALLGVVSHRRAGHVRLIPGLVFGVAGIGGSVVGAALSRRVDPDVLLLAFSGVMVVAAAAMWQRRPEARPPGAAGDRRHPVATVTTDAVRLGVGTATRVVVAGTVVGVLTAFFGVGGGFVIVPALVLTLRFPMEDAVGTSLVVIAVNALVALALRGGGEEIDWALAGPFVVATVIGTLVGVRLGARMSADRLLTGFVVLLVVVASYTFLDSVSAVVRG